MKKKFCPAYTIPVLKLGYRAYIEFFAHDRQGVYRRYRNSWGLGRILNVDKRRKRGEEICAKIEYWLSKGNCIDDFDEYKVIIEIREGEARNSKHSTPILEALEIAQKIKFNPNKANTNRTNKSHIKRFSAFLTQSNLDHLAIGELSRDIAYEYLDHYRIYREVNNNTLNNIIIHMRAIIGTLVERGYLEENPFSRMKKFKAVQKRRRNFNRFEAKAALSYAYDNDRILFYAIMLEYACLIRPSEMYRMRFFHIHPQQGIITLPGKITKNGYDRTVTIPQAFIKYFLEDFWSNHPPDFLIFGYGLQPHGSKSARSGSLYRRHKKMLAKMKRLGHIQDITGLTLYSWKDTGITDIIEELGLMAATDQAGHMKPDVTLLYRHKSLINKKIQGMSWHAIGEESPEQSGANQARG